MDWNKISTILITAFIILNVFLFVSSKDILNSDYGPENDKEFPQEVANLLKGQNIAINTKIPDETYVLPVLETEYEIINIDSKLLQNYLNEKIEPLEDVYKYINNRGESLEIKDGKKLILALRNKVDEKMAREDIKEEIDKFIEQKNIDAGGYLESYVHISEKEAVYMYTLRYNDYPLDNSYMYFFADNEGIYRFEMQRIVSVSEITEKVRTISAIEALPRILTYPDIRNKEISRIEMTYYSVEDENWHNIERINSDPTWKVIFSDGIQVHLPGID